MKGAGNHWYNITSLGKKNIQVAKKIQVSMPPRKSETKSIGAYPPEK